MQCLDGPTENQRLARQSAPAHGPVLRVGVAAAGGVPRSEAADRVSRDDKLVKFSLR